MLPVAAGVLFPALKTTLPPELAGAAMVRGFISFLLSYIGRSIREDDCFVRSARLNRKSLCLCCLLSMNAAYNKRETAHVDWGVLHGQNICHHGTDVLLTVLGDGR